MVELEVRATEAVTPEDRLIAVSLAFVRFGLPHPHHYQAMFSGSIHQYRAELKKQVDAMGRLMFGWLMQAFTKGSEASSQNEETRMLDANTWWIALFWVTYILISSCGVLGSESNEEILKRHVGRFQGCVRREESEYQSLCWIAICDRNSFKPQAIE